MSKIYLLRLSWPDKALSKNVSSPWGKRAQIARTNATATQRKEAWALGRQAGIQALNTTTPTLKFTYYPPDKRKRDVQNIQAMLAGAIDGVGDALGTNDNKFKFVWPETFEEPVRGGAVLIEVSE